MYNMGAPLERMAVDVSEPLPVLHRGNNYVLVIGNYFSKWTETCGIHSQGATIVMRVFVEEFVVAHPQARLRRNDRLCDLPRP